MRQEDFAFKREQNDHEYKQKIEVQGDKQRHVEDKKKEINAKIHERKLLNGDLVT